MNQRGPKFRELPQFKQGERIRSNGSLLEHFAQIAQGNDPEWITDIEYEILGPLDFKSVGSFSETAFFHKLSKTLLVTDTVCSIGEDPPEIIQDDPRAMLFHAR